MRQIFAVHFLVTGRRHCLCQPNPAAVPTKSVAAVVGNKRILGKAISTTAWKQICSQGRELPPNAARNIHSEQTSASKHSYCWSWKDSIIVTDEEPETEYRPTRIRYFINQYGSKERTGKNCRQNRLPALKKILKTVSASREARFIRRGTRSADGTANHPQMKWSNGTLTRFRLDKVCRSVKIGGGDRPGGGFIPKPAAMRRRILRQSRTTDDYKRQIESR